MDLRILAIGLVLLTAGCGPRTALPPIEVTKETLPTTPATEASTESTTEQTQT